MGVLAAGACGWAAVANDAWITIIAGATASGTADVQFVAAANASALPRTGSITIAGQTYTVSQAGAPCSFTLASSNILVAVGGVTGSTFTFSTGAA